MQTAASAEPKLFFPGLAGLYNATAELWYPFIRVGVGAILFVHGWSKLNIGMADVTGYFAAHGFAFAGGFALITIFLETFGALCIMLGLFTRLFAALITLGLVIVLFKVHWQNGFDVNTNGIEHVLLEAIIMAAITLRGGGPYSLDRRAGRQF